MAFSMPVIKYPEGVIVGKVTTQKRNGRLRYVAFNASGGRLGTFDTYKLAQEHVLSAANEGEQS